MRRSARILHQPLATLAIILALVATAPAALAAPGFGAPVQYACPGLWELVGIAVGDINEDGKLDIVGGPGPVWNQPVFYFLGAGGGAFEAMQGATIYVPSPSSLTLGRFRGAGSPLDLAFTNMPQKAVWIVPGNGDATFNTGMASSYATGLDPRHVTTGYFNGDEALDVAVVNRNSNTVSYYPGNGSLAFGAPVSFGTGITPGSLSQADINNDGLPDFVLSSTASGAVHRVLLNDSSREYYPRYDTAAPGALASAVGDFTGDGVPDVAVTSEAQVWILQNNGFGNLSPRAETYGVSGGCVTMVAADLDGDGKQDLVRANLSGNTISVWPGNGDGTLGAKTEYVVGQTPWSMAVSDLDGDGDLDIAVGCNAAPYHVTVLLNQKVVNVPPAGAPVRVALLAPRPNPSSSGSAIAFDLPAATTASVRVVDVQGRTVRTLADGASFAAGRATLTWDGRNDAGLPIGAGVYFVRLKTADGTEDVRKLELLR
jgi:hypothetical protein